MVERMFNQRDIENYFRAHLDLELAGAMHYYFTYYCT